MLFAQLELPEPEQFWYRSFDGKKIEGWILKPPDFSPSKKYPLILEIHGGPHTAYGPGFSTDVLANINSRGAVRPAVMTQTSTQAAGKAAATAPAKPAGTTTAPSASGTG